jgi:hypothetical protein
MDKITISSLIPSSTTNKPIDIHSMYNYKENNTKNNNDISVNKILNLQKERKKKTIHQYDKIFKMCMTRINTANELNYTEIIYTIPTVAFQCPDYNTDDCLINLQNKLRELCFDTFIVSNTDIYVSWFNLENNIKNKK